MMVLQHISKSFPGVKALQDVNLKISSGEIHALCGENGAGKSTLMNIISGNMQPDEGILLLNNKPQKFQSIHQAQQAGICIVHQERSLVESLSIAENIFPVNQPLNSLGFINYKELYKTAGSLLKELQLPQLNPSMPVERLSAAYKQMVEIAKALAGKPSLLLLDEPTASLTNVETEVLFNIIKHLKNTGVGIIYISHRMAEIKQIADVVTVLRDGVWQGTFDAQTTSLETIVSSMVGRELQQMHFTSNAKNNVSLEVKNLSGRYFKNVSFQLHTGEILGFAGLEGSGRSELALAIFGDEKNVSGEIIAGDKVVDHRHPADAIANGFAYIPPDRKQEGLFMDQTVSENVSSTNMRKGLYNAGVNNAAALSYVSRLNVRTPSIKQRVQKLSGGNQQKIALAKWLNIDPNILIVNEPTHGVDIGAKADIYEDLKKLTAVGKSVMLISGELSELLLLCDRIVIMYNGAVRGILSNKEATEELITSMASGLN